MAYMFYVLGPGGIAVPEPDRIRWIEKFGGMQRLVAVTEVGKARVSTVFLGIDHNFGGSGQPLLWETKVFGGFLGGTQQRYSSKEGAERGHNEIVEQLTRDALPRKRLKSR